MCADIFLFDLEILQLDSELDETALPKLVVQLASGAVVLGRPFDSETTSRFGVFDDFFQNLFCIAPASDSWIDEEI